MKPCLSSTLCLVFLLAFPAIAEEKRSEMITKSHRLYGTPIDRIITPDPSGNKFRDMGNGRTLADDELRKFFVECGIEFPQGSSIHYDSAKVEIIMHNTRQAHVELEKVLWPFSFIPTQVEVKLNIYDGPTEKTQINSHLKTAGEPLAAAILLKTLAVTDSISVTTMSGIAARATRTTNKTKFEVNATPTLDADGETMNVTLVWTYRTGDMVSEGATSVFVRNGEFVVVYRNLSGKRSRVIALTVNLVGTDGATTPP